MPEAKTANAYYAEGLRAFERQLQAMSGSVVEASKWEFGRYSIQDLAQDQVVFRVVRGARTETYSGLLKHAHVDAQSDSPDAFRSAPDAMLVMLASLIHDSAHAGLSRWYVEEADLEECLHKDVSEWAPDRLANAIIELEESRDWLGLRDLVLFAEDTAFTTEQSSRVAPRLLALATHYRDSNDPLDAPIVWSALRTGASMLGPDEAFRLLPLLEPGHPIETSLVALKMLGRVFEAQPPMGIDGYPDLEREVGRIACSLLNPYAIAMAQSAAMAQLAVYALAAIGSSRLVAVAQDIRRLGVAWFTRRTLRNLRELQEQWQTRLATITPGQQTLLARALEELRR